MKRCGGKKVQGNTSFLKEEKSFIVVFLFILHGRSCACFHTAQLYMYIDKIISVAFSLFHSITDIILLNMLAV